MRKFLTAALAISSLIFFQQASAQWQWLNPKPSGYANKKIIFTNSTTGFILNGNGDLCRTNNGGNKWQTVQNFPNTLCMDIADSTGVIGGYFGALYVSSDNGNTWSQVYTGINDAFNYINIVSRDTFFLSSNYQYMYETTDRGKTFTQLNCNSFIKCIDFVNSQI